MKESEGNEGTGWERVPLLEVLEAFASQEWELFGFWVDDSPYEFDEFAGEWVKAPERGEERRRE